MQNNENDSFEKIDYLTTTDIYEFSFVGSLPKEAPPFKSLWLPFDNISWAFVLATTLTASLSLFLIEKVWNVAEKKNKPVKYDGKNFLRMYINQFKICVFQLF